jgi:hypothetical protein
VTTSLPHPDTLNGGFDLTTETYPVIRLRLAGELHRRAYHDAGVEVSPGQAGLEIDRTYIVATPHCRHGYSILAQLCWEADRERLAAHGRHHTSWAEFTRSAFTALGVADWRTRRHLGCFHRRGKARYDLVFAVLIQLAAGGPTAWAALDAGEARDQRFQDLVTGAGSMVPEGRPARYLAVTCCGQPLAAMRSDGWTVTPRGVVPLNELWWRGEGEAELAVAIRWTAQHTHSDQPVTERGDQSADLSGTAADCPVPLVDGMPG